MAVQPRKFSLLQFETAVLSGLTKAQIRTRYGISNDTIERRARESKRFQGYGQPFKILTFEDINGQNESANQNQCQREGLSDQPQQSVTSDEDVTAGPYLLSEVVGNDKKIKYVYNQETDSYVNFLKSAPEPVVIGGQMHRDLISAYSNWDGHPSTLNEICRTFSFPRPWLVEYLHNHGITHDKEPFSAEELMETDVSDLVEVALQKKRQALYRSYETAKWQETKQDAEKWRSFKYHALDPLMESIKVHAPRYTIPLLDLPVGAGNERYALVAAAADVHVAKDGWNDMAGNTYSKQRVKDLLKYHVKDVASRVLLHGRPEVIFMPVGNDWFHVDNPQGGTTAGTPQDLNGLPENLMFEAKMMAVELIDMFRQLGPVVLIFCPGNHDWMQSLNLLHFLWAWYRNADDVQVELEGAQVALATQSRQYASYGNSLMGFAHGNDERKSQLGPLMATEAKVAWGQTEFRYYFTGHLHHEESKDFDGVIVKQLPSLSPADRWHDKKGYVLSRRALQVHQISYDRGLNGEFTSAIVDQENSRPVTYGFKLKNFAR